MPTVDKAEISASWFCRHRSQAGYGTITALAQQLGLPVQTVHRWEHAGNQPPWRHMTRLADLFQVQSAEIVQALWGETPGDPCPQSHDCGGKKILLDDPLVQTLQPSLRRYIPGALRLLIKVPCAGCGREHAYPQSAPHPKFCPNCCDRGPKAERKRYRCVGYPRYGKTPAYGPSCPREVDLLPSEVHERLKYNKIKRRRQAWFRYRRLEDGKVKSATTSRKYTEVSWARSFIDESSGTYRCGSCAFASLRFEVQKARLEEISGEEKIRSEMQHRMLWKEYYRELTPGFNSQAGFAERKKLLGRKDGKERLYGEHHRTGTSRGKNIWRWYDPPNAVLLAPCGVCEALTFSYRSQPAKFHDKPCYDSVRGEVRKGVETFSSKRGRVADNENLKRAFCWAVRYLLHEESFLSIANDSHQDRKFVKREIERILPRVPIPDKVPRPFKKIVSLAREAAVKKSLLR